MDCWQIHIFLMIFNCLRILTRAFVYISYFDAVRWRADTEITQKSSSAASMLFSSMVVIAGIVFQTGNGKTIIVRVNSISPRVAELVLCITEHYKLKIVQAPTTAYSEEDINSFYNNVDET